MAAAAIDEVGRGNSVLIATQSEHATEVVTDLLRRHPGPRFVQFGNGSDRENVAAEHSDGLAQPLSSEEHAETNDRATEAAGRAHRTRSTISLLLQREAAFASGLRHRELNVLVVAQAPGVLAEDFDLAGTTRLLERARSKKGLLGGWRQARADKKLRLAVSAEPGATIEDLVAALDAASAEVAVQRGLAGGGLRLDVAWDELESAETEWRNAVGSAIEATRRSGVIVGGNRRAP